jgi:hypothetical protein
VWIDEDDLEDYQEQLERYKIRNATGMIHKLDVANWKVIKAYFSLQ